ncbi:MAG: hypothetical protein DYG84_14685 [Candidatus Brocadia sp. AMX3]|nr:hypothetical protein [Candidatus Brocadia sp. AMX3]
MNYHNAAQPQPKKFNHKERKVLHKDHSAAQPQPNFLYESGVVIASEAKQSFTHKKRYLLKGVCEKTYRKKKFLWSNTIA